MKLENKAAIITGGTGHLGRTVTRTFLEQGARVLLTYHHRGKWEDLRGDLPQELAEHCRGAQTDVTEEGQVRRTVETTLEQFGRIDILLNLVGAFSFGEKVWEMREATWEKMMAVNLKSAFLCCKHVLRAMREAGRGNIINVASKACLDIQPGAAAYAVAKGGLVTLTRALREELKDTDITVNALMPAIIDTPATRELMPEGDPGQWVKPQELADAMVVLCTESCSAVSGTVVRLFGGL